MKYCSEIKVLIYVWFLGGGGRSSIQLIDGTDAVTAGGGGGGAYCVDGCGGGGKKEKILLSSARLFPCIAAIFKFYIFMARNVLSLVANWLSWIHS